MWYDREIRTMMCKPRSPNAWLSLYEVTFLGFTHAMFVPHKFITYECNNVSCEIMKKITQYDKHMISYTVVPW